MCKYLSLIIVFLLAVAVQAQAEDETVYFLVGEITHTHGDSYVLPLTDACDIAHARDLIQFGPEIITEYIVSAIIEGWPGGGINLNRNYTHSSMSMPSWSWYVTEFEGFSELAMEFCDGWPEGVESVGWTPGQTGQICFWGYTVTAELGTEIDPWCFWPMPGCGVDMFDLDSLASHWLDSGCEYPGWCGGVDFDVSGEVNLIDFAILGEYWLYMSGY